MIIIALVLAVLGCLCVWYGAEPYLLFGQAWLELLGLVLLVCAAWVGC